MLILGMILHFLAAGLLVALVNWAGLIPWRKAAGAHWTERARLLWPVRITAGIAIYLVPLLLLGVHQCLVPQSFAMLIVNGLFGFLGGLAGTYPINHELFPQLNCAEWGRQVLTGWLVKLGIYVPLVAAGLCMPDHFGWRMALIALVCLAFLLSIKWGLLRYLFRLMKIHQPAGPRLRQIVSDLAARMNVPVRGVWELKSVTANAVAFIPTRELLFTNRLLEVCSDEEVAAICAHELAHLTESKSVLWQRILVPLLVVYPFIFILPAFHALGAPGLLLPYTGFLVRKLLGNRLSLRMEKRADALALQEQTNEGVYARALEKLYEANLIPAVTSEKRKTHPHLYDRLVAAGLTPDYPRPETPKRANWIGQLLTIAMVIVGMFNFILLCNHNHPVNPH